MAAKSELVLESVSFVVVNVSPADAAGAVAGEQVHARHMCFPLIAGDSPVAPSWADKAILKYRQSTVSKQSEKERECCSGNSSGMGRDLAAVPLLENLTGAASERRLGLLTLGRPRGRLLPSLSAHSRTEGDFHQLLGGADERGRGLWRPSVSMLLFTL